jgi:hypothetical protein
MAVTTIPRPLTILPTNTLKLAKPALGVYFTSFFAVVVRLEVEEIVVPKRGTFARGSYCSAPDKKQIPRR